MALLPLILVAAIEPAAAEIKLWDTNHHYTQKFYGMRETAWKDRADWRQVPYGTTQYEFGSR